MENEVNLSGQAVPWERATIEKLLFAELRERRAARRWRLLRSLLWMGLVGALVWVLASEQLPSATPSSAHTAMVAIKGEISDAGEGSAEYILPALRSAMQDKGAQALVLLINSPGGSPVQAGLIHDEIRRLRALHDKPVYAVVEESCASAAYYIAAGADRIYVDKASLVGSIGVLINGFGFTGTLDKLGVERRLLTAGENKGFLDPFSPQSDAQRAHAQRMLDQIHQQFIGVVRQGRGERLKETPEMFSGLFWTGEQAVQLGLADGLGSLDMVAREVVKAEKLVDYTNKENIAERFAKRLGASVGQGAMAALRGGAGWR
ncbi:MAG TPA: S49 family peptidase [Ottowia sp.]|jgi:protease-4|nr:S49 family peptidase [Burkholderiales bacterium]MCA0311038.1 S49 family peptidase [Pseudomonadota bacterium]OJV61227.1 MAG: S49 family peptidase [Burkholderiales bacterium 68-10]HMT16216.1 S49 family peptidase [Ottowia sp.]HMT56687.1 S49 family peptidase [Ottowia sp.]